MVGMKIPLTKTSCDCRGERKKENNYWKVHLLFQCFVAVLCGRVTCWVKIWGKYESLELPLDQTDRQHLPNQLYLRDHLFYKVLQFDYYRCQLIKIICFFKRNKIHPIYKVTIKALCLHKQAHKILEYPWKRTLIIYRNGLFWKSDGGSSKNNSTSLRSWRYSVIFNRKRNITFISDSLISILS